MAENPGTDTVKNLLQKVHDGSYVIPFFQRGFEWKPRMVSELIESILQNYFTGLLLFWELDTESAKKEEWDPVWGAEKKNIPQVAILDGQQRLSSLYYAIFNPKKEFPNRRSYYSFFIDLNKVFNEEYEESVTYKFYFSNYQSWAQQLANKDEWAKTGIVPLAILSAKDPDNPSQDYIDSDEFADWIDQYLGQHKSVLPSGTNTFKVFKVFNGILNYSFVYYPLSQKRDLHDICNIFAKVNSKGMRLSTFDLMNAFLYPKDVKLRKDLWENLDNESLKQIDSGMDEYLLKVISLHKQNYCSAKYLFNLIPGEATTRKDETGKKYSEILVKSGDEFKSLWHTSCKYSEKARKRIMNTGFSDFGAIKQDFVPNTTIIPVLGAILWEYDRDADGVEFVRNLKRWYWSAVLTEDYSGSSDTVMAKDFRDWKEWMTSGKTIERINRVTPDFINELDLKAVKKGSARYNAILCILALNNARDFFKGQIVGTGSYAKDSINDHHIFPNKVKGLDPTTSKMFSAAKDSIANRTLLLDETNRTILNFKPSEYLQKVRKKHTDGSSFCETLASHLINDAAVECMGRDDFDNFVIEREKAIKAHLIETLEL